MAQSSAPEPYSPCPCGSGKNFRFCCQGIYPLVEKAVSAQQNGQGEAALRLAADLTAKHPESAPAWCYRAQVEMANGKVEAAEASLDKATDLDDALGFPHLIRANLRQAEGEAQGALILFRRAAELYDPKSAQVLTEIFSTITNMEMGFQRPVAARAALERAVKASPGELELKQALDAFFGPESRLPEPARKPYAFRPAPEARKGEWESALGSGASGKVGAAKAFEALAKADPSDSAARFNLALCRAWNGQNAKAVEDLYLSMDAEEDEARLAEAGALAEVLRCGVGMEEEADYVDYVVVFRVHNPQELVNFLQSWEAADRLIALQPDQRSGALSALILEESATIGLGGSSAARLAAHMFVVQDMFRLSNTNQAAVEKVAAEISIKLPGVLQEVGRQKSVANWGDLVNEALMFPAGQVEAPEMERKIKAQAEHYLENQWLHRPLKSLANLAPIDAVASNKIKKRLFGVVRFLEACYDAAKPRIQNGDEVITFSFYDFDRLRRKLGLAVVGGMTQAIESAKLDFGAMAVSELGQLDAASLDESQLGEAYRAALKLDARELAGGFATQAVTRFPAGDNLPYYQHLIGLAQGPDAQLELLARAEAADAEHRGGADRNSLALRRAQIQAKGGRAAEAAKTFDALIQRNPSETKYLVTAAEAMLSAGRGAEALNFAEMGKAVAQAQNNRDLVGHFSELAEAAKRQAK
jgi:thioredoxin-like negative regulator of GroEL